MNGSFATTEDFEKLDIRVGRVGALAGGLIAGASPHFGLTGAAAFRPVLLAYAGIGVALIAGFSFLSSAIEATRDESVPPPKSVLGLHESRRTVFKLSLLFALDAFGGGFVIQSIIAYWFHIRFQLDPAMIGTIFLFANLLAGVSALAAGWLARRIGLINTMIFTHLPSNVLLILVPLMPDVYWAIRVLLLRFSISQMDVPTRQAYTMAVVRPVERSAAAGVTAVARVGGCFNLTHAGDRPCRQRWIDERAVLPGGWPQDRLRPAAISCVCDQ